MHAVGTLRAVAASVALATLLVALPPAGTAGPPAGGLAIARSSRITRPPKLEPTRVVSYRPGRAFTPDTDILSDSGLAAWAIDEYLASHTSLPPLGAAFRKAERRYGVNAIYFVAHAMLESRFGSSDIARFKHNLFGYNAYDRSPYASASSFRSYEAGIAAVAGYLKKQYLSPTGRWWRGYTTMRGVNRFYASDRRWADKVTGLANEVAASTVTLRERGIRFRVPRLRASAVARRTVLVDIPWIAHRGAVLPAGVRFAVRWVPLAVVETAEKAAPSAAATRWRMTREVPAGKGTVRLEVTAPPLAGQWRLEVDARDVDGTVLPKADHPKVPALIVRVGAARGAAVGLSIDPAGRLSATVTNTGRVAIAAEGAGGPTTIEAWALPLDPERPAVLLASQRLLGALPRAGRLAIVFPPPTAAAVVVVRLVGDASVIGRVVPVAALVDWRAASQAKRVRPLPVADPRSDTLLRRSAKAAPIEVDAAGAPSTLALTATVPRPAVQARDESVPTTTSSPAGLLVRTIAANGRGRPTSTLVELAAGAAPGERALASVDGVPAGVRLVVAGIVDPTTGTLRTATLRLAWVSVLAPSVGGI